MNVSKESTDALNAVLTVRIEKADYEAKVASALREHRRKVQVPGFRPGMVPMGMVQKIYGKQVLVDEVFKQITEALEGYIKDNALRTLGYPLPNEQSQPLDFDTQGDFEQRYDVGLAPEMAVKVDKSIKVPYYTIAVAAEEKQKRVEHYRRYFGNLTDVEAIGEDDLVVVDLSQSGEGGHSVEGAMLSLKVIPKDEQQKLMGLGVGSVVALDVRKVLINDTDCAAFLNVAKEALPTIAPMFTFTVKQVRRQLPAELNQEFFDKVYGEGAVASEGEFEAKVEAEMRSQYAADSDYRFGVDARNALLKKFHPELPEAFLKRFLLQSSEDKQLTPEQVEAEFPSFARGVRWQLIEGQLLEQQGLQVEESELAELAKKAAAQQLAAYGLHNLADENLSGFAQRMLERPEERKRLTAQATEGKVVGYIRSVVSIQEKKVSVEEFNKLFEAAE
ncbi:MAG: trigger factor [Prevotellaceae bacterium]|jgi:trigger factor|nr:trigger factor [Prevotellaceae bacterium]